MNRTSINVENWDQLWSTISSEPPQKRLKVEAMEPPEYQIDNVVSTFKFNLNLDLAVLAEKIFHLEYNCSKFTAATVRLLEPRTTALTFPSGSVVCTGAKSVEDSKRAALYYADIFRRVDARLCIEKPAKIQNIVASAKCGFTIRLCEVAERFNCRTSFEMSVFPGLVFRFDSPAIVFLVFRSGSVVITGANSESTISRIFRRFYTHILLPYRDDTKYSHVSNSAEYKRLKETDGFIRSGDDTC